MSTAPAIKHLFLKQARKTSMSAREKLELQQDYGIAGDVNANGKSPRQVLVVDAADLNSFSIFPGELRENIILERVNPEHFKPGAKLTFASGAVIRLTFYCEPCKRMAHLVDSLKSMQQKRGILGVVLKSGAIAVEDHVKLQPDYFPALSEVPYERYLDFLSQVPCGKIVTYKQILEAIGVDRSYFRVLPLYIRKTPASYPTHRILDSQGRTISHVKQQYELLTVEGIELTGDRNSASGDCHVVCVERYAWNNHNFLS